MIVAADGIVYVAAAPPFSGVSVIVPAVVSTAVTEPSTLLPVAMIAVTAAGVAVLSVSAIESPIAKAPSVLAAPSAVMVAAGSSV